MSTERNDRVRDISLANRGLGTVASEGNVTEASVEWDKRYGKVEWVPLTELAPANALILEGDDK